MGRIRVWHLCQIGTAHVRTAQPGCSVFALWRRPHLVLVGVGLCRTLQHECRDEAGPLCSHTSRNPGRRGSDESCKSSYSGHVPVESAPWGTQIQGWAWHANSLLPTAIVSPWHQTYTFERGRDLAERNRQREDQEIVPHSCAYACCSRARTPRRDVS